MTSNLVKGKASISIRKLALLPVILLLTTIAFPAGAQDQVDEKATAMIKEFTTDPKFLTPLVDYLPASGTVPSQLEVLGYISGTPGKHTYYADIVRYLQTLADKSERVKIFEIGKSHQGATMILVAIADEEVINNLDDYRNLTKKLADPRSCSKEEMADIAKKGKPFYLITGGLHSPETGSPEMLMELAYRLAVSETEMIKRIRSNVITLIVPVLEIDGWNRQVDWYYRHTKKVEEWEDLVTRSSPYWGKYTHHDNNRDGIMVSQPLTKNLFKAFFMFHPQVCLDLHESVALLYVSTGTGPYYTSLDPIVIDEWQWFSFNEVTQLTRYGVPGVWTHAFYTGWYPGYMLWLPNNHNSIGRFYETFGNAGANTYERDITSRRGGGRSTRQWYRPLPPPANVKWSLRNNNNLMQSGVLVSLDFTARHRDTVIENFWIKGNNALEAGKNEAPYAWIIPPEQNDPLAADRLLEVLRWQHVEMHILNDDLTLSEKAYPAGSVVIRMDQPYRTIAKTLLEVQNWPKGNQVNPYDATGWTLGLMLGVETIKIDDKAVLEALMDSLGAESPFNSGRIEGMKQGDYLIVPPQGTATMEAFIRLSEEGVEVKAADTEFEHNDISFPSGTWILPGFKVEGGSEQGKAAEKICRDLGLRAYLFSNVELPALREINMPRIALYHSWFNTQESGWTRFAIDQAKVPYTLINKDRVRQGNLLSDFDVIIIPHQGGWGRGARMLRGIDDRSGPIAFNKTDEFKFMGYPDSSDDITGGLGLEGLLEIERFVSGGGTLITLGSGSSLITDFGFVRGIGSQQARNLTCPGTILACTVRQPGNPVAYGYCEHPSVYRSRLPVISVEKRMRKYVVMQFGTKLPPDEQEESSPYGRAEEAKETKGDRKPKKKVPLLRSGLLRGGEAIDGSAAIVDAPMGKGRVILFAFNPMYRWMNHANFPFVFNSILHWQAPAELRETKEEAQEES